MFFWGRIVSISKTEENNPRGIENSRCRQISYKTHKGKTTYSRDFQMKHKSVIEIRITMALSFTMSILMSRVPCTCHHGADKQREVRMTV